MVAAQIAREYVVLEYQYNVSDVRFVGVVYKEAMRVAWSSELEFISGDFFTLDYNIMEE
jgi:hypothetical protein